MNGEEIVLNWEDVDVSKGSGHSIAEIVRMHNRSGKLKEREIIEQCMMADGRCQYEINHRN